MALWDVLWPVRCAGCDVYGAPVCASCAVDLSALQLPVARAGGSVASAFRYESVARSLVLGLKVRCVRSYSEPLAAGITAVVQRGGFTPDAITWVPARPSAKHHRGFDQAELLARGVGRRAGLECFPTLRAHERRDQVGLGRTMRALNASSGFRATRRPPRGAANLLLVDDLFTTGATARACMTALTQAGWAEVSTVTACRA